MLKGSLPEVFFDTDVCFGIISKRDPTFENAIKLLENGLKGPNALQIAECSIAQT